MNTFQKSVGKFFLKSTTVWGGLITIIFGAISAYGIDVPVDAQNEVKGLIFQYLNDSSKFMTMVGGLIAIFGRIVAKEPVTLKISRK